MTLHADTECPVCGERVTDGPWLLLNRYGIGNGDTRALVEGIDEDDVYTWDVTDDDDQDDRATGYVLHWPTCAIMWIDGQVAESRVEARKRGWIQ